MNDFEKQIEEFTNIFTDEDKAFNMRMVAEGRKAQGKSLIPSVTEPSYDNCHPHKKEENDDYDFTSKILKG